jgi:hypothetical protein
MTRVKIWIDEHLRPEAFTSVSGGMETGHTKGVVFYRLKRTRRLASGHFTTFDSMRITVSVFESVSIC